MAFLLPATPILDFNITRTFPKPGLQSWVSRLLLPSLSLEGDAKLLIQILLFSQVSQVLIPPEQFCSSDLIISRPGAVVGLQLISLVVLNSGVH